MESSLKELAMYRMERAFEMLIAAEDNLKIEQYNSSFTLVAKKQLPQREDRLYLWP